MEPIILLMKGARLAVETCMGVKANKNILIIADTEHMAMAEALAAAAYAMDANVIIINATSEVAKAMSTEVFEPPRHMAETIKSSDAILVSAYIEYAHRFAHVDAVRAAVDAGARICSVEEGMAEWNMTLQDIEETIERTEKLIKAMEGAKWVRVTSAKGTDVKLSIEGRPPLRVLPIKKPGEIIGPVPLWGEVAYAPLEDKTEGVFIYDGIMLGTGTVGPLREPIKVTVRGGRAVKFEGGAEADRLRKTIEQADENANVIAEFAIGTGHKEKYDFPSEKGALGTMHFGIGDNKHCYPGGQNVSKVHLDGTVRNPTIEVDGKVIIENGILKV